MNEIIELFSIKNGEEIKKIFVKKCCYFFTCVFVIFKKVSLNEFDNISVYGVSLPGFTWRSGMNYAGRIFTNTSR